MRDSWLRKGVRAEHLQQMEIIEDQNESQCSEKTKKAIFNVHGHLDTWTGSRRDLFVLL